MKCYRRLAVVVLSVATAMTLIVGPAIARQPTRQHVSQYQRLYRQTVQKYGHRAPGRNIVRWGLVSRRAVSDTDVRHSLAVLRRMLAPPPVPRRMAGTVGAAVLTHGSGVSVVAPAGGLVACILLHESTDGQTSRNIAQWQGSAWAEDGGTRYAPSPEQASYAQQVSVLSHALANGESWRWRPYDHC